MISEMVRRPVIGGGGNNEGSYRDDNNNDELEKEFGLLMREQRRQEAVEDDRDSEMSMYRSGSAPPTVEGSLNAVGGLGLFGNSGFSEYDGVRSGTPDEEMRSDPAYLSYYYSNVNMNPRLPPPLVSKEGWRLAQRLQGGGPVVGGIGDRRKVIKSEMNGIERSLFAMPPGFGSKKEERELEKSLSSVEWGNDGLIGLPGMGLGSKQKSFVETLQDDLSSSNPNSRHPSRPASRNAFDENADALCTTEAVCQDNGNAQGSSTINTVSAPTSYSYAAVLGASLSRGNTPDPQHVPRVPSPCITPIGGGRTGLSEKRTISGQNSFNTVVSGMNESADLAAALSDMSLSINGGVGDGNHLPSKVNQDAGGQRMYHLNMQAHNDNNKHSYGGKIESGYMHMPAMSQSARRSNVGGPELRKSQVVRPKASLNSGIAGLKGSYASTYDGGLSPNYGQLDGTNSPISNYGLGGYSVNSPLSPMMTSQHGIDSRVLRGVSSPSGQALHSPSEFHDLSRTSNQILGNGLQGTFVDPMYLQYLRAAEYAAQLSSLNDHSPNAYTDSLQKAYIDSLLSHQKSQFGAPFYNNNKTSPNQAYYGNHAFGIGMGYHGSPLGSPMIPNSPAGPGSPVQHNEFNMRYLAAVRNSNRGMMKPWPMDGNFVSSLLDEFKCNKTKCFELAEIAGHVVDFSMDQYGSRFIQQKLETATVEEINMVFQEIIPQALALMTDVFGNYVIQKFFENGLPDQRRELASKLDGHVLTLSLQMYGCRVIQKAVEVVDLDQKIKMVEELAGHVMRCVRDQNGNHVIQKCIECVPEESIQFIIQSFFDQVVTLSTHPYGCRVIQRVLEHCKDPDTQSKAMEEILGSVSMLTQDQYGNYVVQHVLEHGNPHERSIIIKELAGKIVQMSQQKFASNVVEKCLTFGGPNERELLVNEMLGTTDENEPLQAMMKDQFGNYVVQKVLETCNDQQRELIMSRIKVHLSALKKYTYGKHIVARVEKLLAAGERRAGMSQNPAA